jgi:hypothetical protein
MGNTSHAPHDIGEGLNAIGQALMYRNLMKGVNTSEASGYGGASKVMASLFGGGDQNQFPAAPALSATSPASTIAPTGDHPVPPADVGSPSAGNDYFSAIRSAESGGSDSAKNPTSSATGRYQFTTGTWGDVAAAHPELGLTSDGRLDPAQQEKAIRAFTADNANQLSGAGIPTTGGNLYAAHFLGASGAQNVLTQPDSSPVAAHVAPEVVQANPFLAKMSVGQFKQWAASKGGGNAPVDLGGNSPQMAALPSQAPIPQPSPIQVASNDPSAGMGSIPPASGPQPNAMPALPAAGPIPPDRPLPTGIDPSMLSAPMPYAPQPAPNDAKAAIAQAMAGQGGGVPASAPAPAAQKIAAALMQQQALTGGAPMGMQAPTGAPVPPQALPAPDQSGKPQGPGAPGEIRKGTDGKTYQYAQTTGMAGATGDQGWIETSMAAPDAAPAPQQVAQAAPAPASPQGPDASQLPAMAGGNSDVVQPGSMPRTGPTPQQLIEAAGNPWVMQRYGPIVDAMISQQMTPHKLEMVPLGNGITAEIDSLTGKQVGQIKGQPDLKSIKDAAGNEYMFNPADPTHPITVDTLLGGGGQAGGQAAPSGQADPYASPFPRTIARTDVMKDYEGYLAQSKSLNQPPMSFNDYQMNLKKEGAQSVVFNQENAANKAVGEAVGNNMADYINGAKDARSKLQALNLIKGVLDQNGDNISTGPGANTMLSLKQGLANIFPSMADAATPTEMLQKLSTQLATADAKGLASRPTQFDFATYLKNNPGIQMSIQGQKALVDLKLQQAQHDYELGSMATHKQYASDPGGWADVVAKYDQEHPLINPLTGKPADASATDFPAPKDGAQAAPATAAPVAGAKQAPDGNWYVPDPNRPGKYLKVVQ